MRILIYNPLKNQNGESLIMVLVSISLTTVLSLYTASLIRNQMIASKSVEQRVERAQLSSSISQVLNQSENVCSCLLDRTQNTALADQPLNLSNLQSHPPRPTVDLPNFRSSCHFSNNNNIILSTSEKLTSGLKIQKIGIEIQGQISAGKYQAKWIVEFDPQSFSMTPLRRIEVPQIVNVDDSTLESSRITSCDSAINGPPTPTATASTPVTGYVIDFVDIRDGVVGGYDGAFRSCGAREARLGQCYYIVQEKLMDLRPGQGVIPADANFITLRIYSISRNKNEIYLIGTNGNPQSDLPLEPAQNTRIDKKLLCGIYTGGVDAGTCFSVVDVPTGEYKFQRVSNYGAGEGRARIAIVGFKR